MKSILVTVFIYLLYINIAQGCHNAYHGEVGGDEEDGIPGGSGPFGRGVDSTPRAWRKRLLSDHNLPKIIIECAVNKLETDTEPPDSIPLRSVSDVAVVDPRNSQNNGLQSQCHRYKTLCMDVMLCAVEHDVTIPGMELLTTSTTIRPPDPFPNFPWDPNPGIPDFGDHPGFSYCGSSCVKITCRLRCRKRRKK